MVDVPEKVEVRSPRAGELFSVNPDPAQRGEHTLIRDEDGKVYLVAENMVEKITELAPPERIERVMIFVAQNIKGELFLWPVKMPVPDEHIAYHAMHNWVEYPMLQ